jgi:SAM-dependent methyltransferase
MDATSAGRKVAQLATNGRSRIEGHWRFYGQIKAAGLLLDRYGDAVAGGPFAGMRYPVPAEVDLCLPPKLSGRYEQELHPVIERLLDRRWRTIVDVGCAAGYYTTGLALRAPEARVVGFEGSEELAALARRNAEVNGVADRVDIRGFCGPDELEPLLGPETFAVLDVEGYEETLTDPERLPAVLQTTLLIELHDFAVPGVSSLVLARFAGSHRVSVIHADPPSARDAVGAAEAAVLPRRLRRWVVDEHRPAGMRWAICEPHVPVGTPAEPVVSSMQPVG